VQAGQLLERLAARLRRARLHFGHGATDAPTEAFWLIAHALKLDFATLDATLDRLVPARTVERIEALTTRRIETREPLAYLLGEAWLGPWRFVVDRRVIVPRSFIAPLLATQLSPWLARPGRVRRILDLCTGSGCLAIVAAHQFPKAQVDAIDLSAAALQVARRNVALHGLADRVRLLRGDLFAPLALERYDLILTNPPYVTESAMKRLPAEYHAEPALALAGGRDGLDLVDRIFAQAAPHLAPRGLLVVETGHARSRIEKRWPALPLLWSEEGGGDIVCMIGREDLPSV
jgi:ribosomal protein L3 glutamine methyltransferase